MCDSVPSSYYCHSSNLDTTTQIYKFIDKCQIAMAY